MLLSDTSHFDVTVCNGSLKEITCGDNLYNQGKGMDLKFQGKKKGMTMRFDAEGNRIVCTVILLEPNVVAQIKSSKDKDGYNAVQLAAYKVEPSKIRNVSKPLKGHFAKANIEPRSSLKESRVDNVEDFQVGQEFCVNYFDGIDCVDVSGFSKGKGHQGVIVRHNFAGGPASHGSGFHRHGGSTGMRSSPGRCLPGQKKSGRTGNEMVTIQNLPVVMVDFKRHFIVVKGAVPGPRNGLVTISKAKKKNQKKKA